MIKSIHLVNFFSFRDAEIKLEENLTALVGLNGSGKSNLLRALRLLQAGMNGQLFNQIIKWGGFDSVFCHSKSEDNAQAVIQIELILDCRKLQRFGYGFQQDVRYCVKLVKKGNAADYYVEESAVSVESAKSPGGFIYLELKNGSGMVYDRGDEDSSSVKPKRGLKKVSVQKNNPEATTEDDYEKLNPRELWLGQVNNAKRFPGATAIAKALHSSEVSNSV